jgi:SOS-response transcriptional repressor LexA
MNLGQLLHPTLLIHIETRETAQNGETVVAMINKEEVTLKRLYIEPDHIRLQPANPDERQDGCIFKRLS